MNILERIQGHEDLVRLSQVEQAQLCDELRQFLVSNVAQTGGHLASNLGVVTQLIPARGRKLLFPWLFFYSY